MKFQLAIVLTIFVSLLAVIASQDQRQVYCGRRLSYALSLVCENGLIKRSETMYDVGENYGLPWIPMHHAKNLGRGKRQVASECCVKPCSINELQAYCAE